MAGRPTCLTSQSLSSEDRHPGKQRRIVTPDKANAVFLAGLSFAMNDDDPDAIALQLGNFILGGGTLSSRLGDRIRQKEGLSDRRLVIGERSITRQRRSIFNQRNYESCQHRRGGKGCVRRAESVHHRWPNGEGSDQRRPHGWKPARFLAAMTARSPVVLPPTSTSAALLLTMPRKTNAPKP